MNKVHLAKVVQHIGNQFHFMAHKYVLVWKGIMNKKTIVSLAVSNAKNALMKINAQVAQQQEN